MRVKRTESWMPGETCRSSRRRLGQSLSEYALLLTLVAAVILAGLGLLGTSTAERVRGVSDRMGAGRSSVHVAGIDLSVKLVPPMVKVTGLVTVRDQDGRSVSGATVSVNWYVDGTLAESDVDATDTQGSARFTHKVDEDEVEVGDVVRLSVTGVAASGYGYDSASNVQSEAQIVVP